MTHLEQAQEWLDTNPIDTSGTKPNRWQVESVLSFARFLDSKYELVEKKHEHESDTAEEECNFATGLHKPRDCGAVRKAEKPKCEHEMLPRLQSPDQFYH